MAGNLSSFLTSHLLYEGPNKIGMVISYPPRKCVLPMWEDLERHLSRFIFKHFLEQKPCRCQSKHGQKRKEAINIGVHVAAAAPMRSIAKRGRNQQKKGPRSYADQRSLGLDGRIQGV